MSLLMEALKKAEQAKKAGQGESAPATQTEEAVEPSSPPLEILPVEPAPPENSAPAEFPPLELESVPERPTPASQEADLVLKPETGPVVTEASTPALQEAGLQLQSQEAASAAEPPTSLADTIAPIEPPSPSQSTPPAPSVPQPEPEPPAPVPPPPAPPTQPAPPPRPSPVAAAAIEPALKDDEKKKTASKVFLAKQAPARSSKRRVLALAGLAAGIALGGGAYIYWQISRPASTGFAASPVAGTPQPGVPPVATPPAEAAATPAQEGSTPVTLANAPAEPQPATPQPAAAQPQASPPAEPVSPPKAVAPQSNLPASGIKIERSPSVSRVNPTLASAYQALMSGNDRAAQADYAKVLKQDATNRDALLGLAAIASRAGRLEEAGRLYQRLLELNPKDPAALAGLVAISGQADPVQSESRVKNMLAQQPDSPNLHFSLGNLYLSQSRWAEAQQAFFMAFKGEPSNPDYAFNLAVSLDHLNQRKAALDYYRRALTLSSSRSASFDRPQVQARIEELTAAAQ